MTKEEREQIRSDHRNHYTACSCNWAGHCVTIALLDELEAVERELAERQREPDPERPLNAAIVGVGFMGGITTLVWLVFLRH